MALLKEGTARETECRSQESKQRAQADKGGFQASIGQGAHTVDVASAAMAGGFTEVSFVVQATEEAGWSAIFKKFDADGTLL